MELLSGDELVPYLEVKRSLCPYFEFLYFSNYMIDHRGKKYCALKGGLCGLCDMEEKKLEPDLSTCSLGEGEERKAMERKANKIRVYANEFRPPDEPLWPGISLEKWLEHKGNNAS